MGIADEELLANNDVSIREKICLTLPEASKISGFTVFRIKQIIKKDPQNGFAVFKDFKQGRHQLIKRKEFEEYISSRQF